jgi:hypothetical protein
MYPARKRMRRARHDARRDVIQGRSGAQPVMEQWHRGLGISNKIRLARSLFYTNPAELQTEGFDQTCYIKDCSCARRQLVIRKWQPGMGITDAMRPTRLFMHHFSIIMPSHVRK